MRLLQPLILASLLIPAPALAQKDTVFKDVEYLSGLASMEDKEKGTLVVAAAEVRLADKKGKPYLAVPLVDIQEANNIVFDEKDMGDKIGNAVKKGLGSLGGVFGGGGPEHRLLVTVRRDSATSDTIVFKIHKEKEAPKISSAIQTRIAKARELASRPIMLVANPFMASADSAAASAADSTAAVQVGSALRQELAKFVGDKFLVVTREQMNTTLESYGYPADALLSPALTETLASEIQAAVLISGSMTKGENGLYTVTASLNAVGATPGAPVTVEQNAEEKLDDFGRRVAEALK